MLNKREKLSASEVRAILKKGRAVRTAHVLAKYKTAGSRKAAVVISKKIARSAVERNRLRRALYRALRQKLPARIHAVFLVQKKTDDFTPDTVTICSKLS